LFIEIKYLDIYTFTDDVIRYEKMLVTHTKNKSFKGTYLVGYSVNVINIHPLNDLDSNEKFKKIQQQLISFV
jgi:hypothetical protein